MIIEINTDQLVKSELTADQFLISFIIYERAFNTFESLRLYNPTMVNESVKTLVEKGYILKTSNRIGYTVTKSFLKFVVEVDSFDELLSKFPVYVIRNTGNKDYLRTDKDRCKRKYQRITKSKKSKHDFIMQCLDYEIKKRIEENSLCYMKKLPNWIDGKEWETWAERLEHEHNEKESTSYGTELE